MTSTTGLLIESPAGTYEVVSHYRIREASAVAILENQVSFVGNKKIVSRATYSPRTHQLKDYTCSFDYDGNTMGLSVVSSRSGFQLLRRSGGKRWTEFVPEAETRIVPYSAFAYAETAYVLRRLDWTSAAPQAFPMLAAHGGSEFGFRGFYYVFRVLEISGQIAHIRCANLSRGPFGDQMEPYDLWFDRERATILRLRNEPRNLTLVAREPTPSDRPFDSHPVNPNRRAPKRVPMSRRRVAAVRQPISLSLLAQRPRKSTRKLKSSLWVFDLYRPLHEHIYGTRFRRDHIADELDHLFAEFFTFDDLIATSLIGFTKQPIDPKFSLASLAESVLRVWKKLDRKRRTATVLMAFEENTILPPWIFSKMNRPPPLILMNPFWGTLQDYLRRANPTQELGYATVGGPVAAAFDLYKHYPSPILAFGENAPPHALPHLTFWKLPPATSALATGPNVFEDAPQPLPRSLVTNVRSWITEIGEAARLPTS